MSAVTAWLAKGLASAFYVSYLPCRSSWAARHPTCTGAGHVGTLAGLLTLPLIPASGWAAWSVLAGGLLLSVAVADYAEEAMGVKDDPRIVIDEWIGFWCSAAFLPRTWTVLAAAFILFRLFDAWKPAGIRRLSYLPGGWGVVMDDIVAGLLVNAVLHAAIALAGLL